MTILPRNSELKPVWRVNDFVLRKGHNRKNGKYRKSEGLSIVKIFSVIGYSYINSRQKYVLKKMQVKELAFGVSMISFCTKKVI